MSEKTISVKCAVNEKNKEAIKHALSDALELKYSLWRGDTFDGKPENGRVTYKIKIDESLISNGYKILISFEETVLGIFIVIIGVGISGVAAFFLSKIFFYLLGCLLREMNVDISSILSNNILCGVLGIVALVFFGKKVYSELGFDSQKNVSKKIDDVAKELNL